MSEAASLVSPGSGLGFTALGVGVWIEAFFRATGSAPNLHPQFHRQKCDYYRRDLFGTAALQDIIHGWQISACATCHRVPIFVNRTSTILTIESIIAIYLNLSILNSPFREHLSSPNLKIPCYVCHATTPSLIQEEAVSHACFASRVILSLVSCFNTPESNLSNKRKHKSRDTVTVTVTQR